MKSVKKDTMLLKKKTIPGTYLVCNEFEKFVLIIVDTQKAFPVSRNSS